MACPDCGKVGPHKCPGRPAPPAVPKKLSPGLLVLGGLAGHEDPANRERELKLLGKAAPLFLSPSRSSSYFCGFVYVHKACAGPPMKALEQGRVSVGSRTWLRAQEDPSSVTNCLTALGGNKEHHEAEPVGPLWKRCPRPGCWGAPRSKPAKPEPKPAKPEPKQAKGR